MKYSFSSLKTTARGDLKPPRVCPETISSEFEDIFKQLAIYLAVGFAVGIAGRILGRPGLMIAGGLAILLLPLLAFLSFFFQNYYTLMSYNLMGYVLLQFHDEIGYEVAYEDFHHPETKTNKVSPVSPLLKQVEIHIKGGEYDAAMDLLSTEKSTSIF